MASEAQIRTTAAEKSQCNYAEVASVYTVVSKYGVEVLSTSYLTPSDGSGADAGRENHRETITGLKPNKASLCRS